MSALNLTAVALQPPLRPDLAWQDSVIKQGAAGVSPLRIKAPGENALYFTTATVTVVTDANPGNRLLLWDVENPDGQPVLQLPAPAQQAASLFLAYSLNLGVSSAYIVADAVSMPLPSFLILPGWALAIFLSGIQVGDTIKLNAALIKVPTGPPLGTEPGTLLGSPLRLRA